MKDLREKEKWARDWIERDLGSCHPVRELVQNLDDRLEAAEKVVEAARALHSDVGNGKGLMKTYVNLGQAVRAYDEKGQGT